MQSINTIRKSNTMNREMIPEHDRDLDGKKNLNEVENKLLENKDDYHATRIVKLLDQSNKPLRFDKQKKERKKELKYMAKLLKKERSGSMKTGRDGPVH